RRQCTRRPRRAVSARSLWRKSLGSIVRWRHQCEMGQDERVARVRRARARPRSASGTRYRPRLPARPRRWSAPGSRASAPSKRPSLIITERKTPPKRRRRRECALQCVTGMRSGGRYVGGVVLLRWLCESLTKLSQLAELIGAELGEPLCHVLHCLAEPLSLM